MAKAKEVAEKLMSGNAYLKEVLALIPDEKKDTVLNALGEHVMLREDYSRGKDAVDAYKQTLDGWYAEKVGFLESGSKAVEELEALKKASPAAGTSAAVTSLEGYIKKDEVEKLLNERLRQSEETGLAVMTPMVNLAAQHLHDYGKPLNSADVVAYARKNGKNLNEAYLDITADARQAKAEATEKARMEKLRQEIRAEVIKEQGHQVYPVGIESASGSALSGLKSKENTGVAAAIADYNANAMSRRAQ